MIRSKDKGARLVIEGLEKLLEDVEEELRSIEARLAGMCIRFNVTSLDELDRLFRSKIDNPDIDLAWPEYRFLIDRRNELLKKRKEIREQLKRHSGHDV